MKRKMPPVLKWVDELRAVHKLVFSIGFGALITLSLLATGFQILTGIMIGWDCFSICLILLSWLTFYATEAEDLRLQAKKQDESRYTTFMIVLLSVCVSIVGIIFIMFNKDDNLVHKNLNTEISIAGVALSWFLLHTTFTLRYAHLYYEQSLFDEHELQDGILFPGNLNEPDYFDFAYFSFIIGMTFQVSDVKVTSSKIRRVVLTHGLIAFVFNTLILAITISILANFPGK